MVHTIHYIFLPHAFNGLSDHGLVTILDDACELACPQCPELLLHLAEYKLDWVVFWTVWHVEDAAESESRCLCQRLLAPVGREVVHEQGYLLVAVSRPQLLEVLLELLDVNGVLVHLVILQTFLL